MGVIRSYRFARGVNGRYYEGANNESIQLELIGVIRSYRFAQGVNGRYYERDNVKGITTTIAFVG